MPTYFAEIDPTTKEVLRVIVADQEFIDSGKVGNPANWVQTWMDDDVQKGPRKNYAGRGHIFDAARNAFVEPKPFTSWVLDEATAKWKAPKERPTDGKAYRWNEQLQEWQAVGKPNDVTPN